MATFDQMIIDDRDLANRYFGENNFDDLDDDQYLLNNNSQPFSTNPLIKPESNNDTDDENRDLALFGRRVFLESPALGDKEEEQLYRFVPSRLSDHASTMLVPSVTAPTGDTLIDSLDFELDILGATNTRPTMPFRTNPQLFQNSKPPAPLTQMTNPITPMTNMRRADPRQDPLLGPLLAELDAMSTQQQRLTQGPPPPAATTSDYRRNSVPYEPVLARPPVQSHSNHALTTTGNRTLNNELFDTDLYDSLEQRNQQISPVQHRQVVPLSAPHISSSNQPLQQPPPPPQQQKQLPPRQSNMNSTDIFMPSSYDTGPSSFLNNFGAEDQLFQQPLFNALGQNYVPNPRTLQPPQPQQQPTQQQYEKRDGTFDNNYRRASPPLRPAYAPPQQQQQPPPPPPPPNRQIRYDDNNDPFSEYHEMFAPSRYQRPPTPPSQQQQRRTPPSERRPPPSQQQRPPPPPQPQYPRSYQPSQQQQQQPRYYDEPPNQNSQEMFFTDQNDDQLDQFSHHQLSTRPPSDQHNEHDQDSRRQAVWHELQRNNAKVQEKNAKKRESANRREQLLKGNYGSGNAWNGSHQSSAQSKTGGQFPSQRRRPPPIPISKTNYIEDNIDMIRNKENFYHRYPAKKYENLYSKRKDLVGEGNNNRKSDADQNQDDYDETQTSMNNPVATYSDPQHRSSLPVTINLNPHEYSQGGNAPGSGPIPLDSHVSRTGDKISVNIDLRLVDLQNLKRQQENNEHPDWSGLDPLDRHIRKLERSIDHKSKQILPKFKPLECRWIDCCCQRQRRHQSLPQITSPNQRTPPTLSNPTLNASMGRYGKNTTGAGQGGYNPPNYASDEYYNYGEKGQEEDSYLARMNHMKQGPHFKPYTGKDYQQFKKNYGFGGGTLGFDFDNPNYKEKSDKLTKTKEYAQQIESRNKKKLAEAPRRTLSDTRLPTELSKTQRALEYARVSTRHKQSSGPSNQPDMNGSAPPHRRPTEVLNRPPPPPQRQPLKPSRSEDNELVERLAQRHERDKAQVQGMLNPSSKRREPLFDDDDRHATDIERQAQDRANQRRLSPPRQLPPSGTTSNGNARKPLRFDRAQASDGSPHPAPPPPQHYDHQYRPSQQPPLSATQPHQQSRRSAPQPPSPPLPQHQPSRRSDQRPASPPQHQQSSPSHQQSFSHNRHSGRHHQTETNIDELANRHNDEKMLMEAIRQELSERPLGDDEELIVVEQ